MPKASLFVLLGVVAGILGGLIGVGGGVIIVPCLVFIFGMSQHQAQGTTLALLVPPIGLLAAYNYYQRGYVDLKVAALICLGFVAGSYFGSKLAVSYSNTALQRIFGAAIMLIGLKMLWPKS